MYPGYAHRIRRSYTMMQSSVSPHGYVENDSYLLPGLRDVVLRHLMHVRGGFQCLTLLRRVLSTCQGRRPRQRRHRFPGKGPAGSGQVYAQFDMDLESNEVKYLRDATELIEEWQFRLQGVQRVSAPA